MTLTLTVEQLIKNSSQRDLCSLPIINGAHLLKRYNRLCVPAQKQGYDTSHKRWKFANTFATKMKEYFGSTQIHPRKFVTTPQRLKETSQICS